MQKTLVVRLLTYTVGSRPLVLYVVSYLKTTVFSTPSASVWFQTRHHHSSRGREQAREIPLERGGRGWGGACCKAPSSLLCGGTASSTGATAHVSARMQLTGESPGKGKRAHHPRVQRPHSPLRREQTGKNKKQTGKRVRQQQRWGRSGNGERRPLSLIRCTAHRK